MKTDLEHEEYKCLTEESLHRRQKRKRKPGSQKDYSERAGTSRTRTGRNSLKIWSKSSKTRGINNSSTKHSEMTVEEVSAEIKGMAMGVVICRSNGVR